MRGEPLGTAQTAASDEELLRAIANGSEVAFEELRGRYGRAVARVCRGVAGSDAQSDPAGHFSDRLGVA